VLFVVAAYVLLGEARGAEATAAIVAGVIGFCYFAQQQKLAETQLFHTLFTAFNGRYDAMNGDLIDIVDGKLSAGKDVRKIVVDYFNLCAEEYLFFREGYIHDEVWCAWCRGMLWYLRRHPFREIWNDEVTTDSFYGLTLEVIQAGAALGPSKG
jgi:hypothetical protein